MLVPQQELRATRRFNLRLPVEVKYSADTVRNAKAHTRDVSSRGICFYFDTEITPGSDIEFTLTLPPEITLTESDPRALQGHSRSGGTGARPRRETGHRGNHPALRICRREVTPSRFNRP